MNIWDFIESNRNQNKWTFKKWLDVKSDHFFSLELDHNAFSYSIQRKIAKRNAEELNETGNHLIYVSSRYTIVKNEVELPIFLAPVKAIIDKTLHSIRWSMDDELFYLNRDAFDGRDTVLYSDIESWLAEHKDRLNAEILRGPVALYFNVNTRKSTRDDINSIYERMESSQAIDSLFNDSIKLGVEDTTLDFLSLHHFLPMDSSQARTIHAASSNAIVISGPPGTGKSQTILNLAMEEISVNKRVVIISEKQAALDVLIQRAEMLRLNRFIMALPFHKKENDVIRDFEISLDQLLNYSALEAEYPFNIAYYSHAIRTLEDYYMASTQRMKSGREDVMSPMIDKLSIRNSNLFWMKPSPELIDLDLIKTGEQLTSMKAILHRLNIDFKKEKFSLFQDLESILDLLSNYNSVSLCLWLDNKSTAKKSWLAKKKKITSLELKLKRLNVLDFGLPNASLQYLKSFYLHSNFISKLFNSNAKELETSIAVKDKSWRHKNTNLKTADLDSNIQLNQLNIELRDAKDSLEEIETKNEWRNTISILEYIESKLNSGSPIWLFVYEHFILTKSHNERTVLLRNLSQILLELKKSKIDLNDVLILDFLSQQSYHQNPITKSDWDALCCMKFKERAQWVDFLNEISRTAQKEPVLKNYSVREIAGFAKYCRRNYNEFIQYKNHSWLQGRMSEDQQKLTAILSSKKPDLKSRRSKWKKSIEFIQKNWSQKRKKISLFQYLSHLDFEFITFLKPISILSFEQLSQYSPLEKEMYDTLIIDESSQVEAINSIPALYRSKKVIIVGDSKQLTPSRFFRNTPRETMHSYESILELAEEKLQKYTLNGHYRSRYRELIGYSNANFYHDHLLTTRVSGKDAIHYQYIENGRYENRQNTIEARDLVHYLCAHLARWQDKSIGVICFSIQQKEAIEDILDEVADKNSDLKIQLKHQREKSEFFFVKNIENVQGDERDIILISIGYGRNEKGKIYQFFGPVLSFQGENRLNVLMSRSKEKLAIFSSLRAQDIQVKTHSSNGLKLFKELLNYVENPYESISKSNLVHTNFWEYYLHPFRN